MGSRAGWGSAVYEEPAASAAAVGRLWGMCPWLLLEDVEEVWVGSGLSWEGSVMAAVLACLHMPAQPGAPSLR